MKDQFPRFIQQLSTHFYNPTKFEQTLRKYYLNKTEGDKSEIGLSAGIYGMLHMGIVTGHFQSFINLQFPIENKRIDTFFTSMKNQLNNKENFAVIHEYKLNNTKKQSNNHKFLQKAIFQCLVNNYLQACSLIPKDRVWSDIIIRGIVFWQNSLGHIDIVIKEHKIPANKYTRITDMFSMKKLAQAMKNSGMRCDQTKKNLRTFMLENDEKALKSILLLYNQRCLDDLIMNAIKKEELSASQYQLKDKCWFKDYGLTQYNVRQQWIPSFNRQQMKSNNPDELEQNIMQANTSLSHNLRDQGINICIKSLRDDKEQLSESQEDSSNIFLNQPIANRLRSNKGQNKSSSNIQETSFQLPKNNQRRHITRATQTGFDEILLKTNKDIGKKRKELKKDVRSYEKQQWKLEKRNKLERQRRKSNEKQ